MIIREQVASAAGLRRHPQDTDVRERAGGRTVARRTRVRCGPLGSERLSAGGRAGICLECGAVPRLRPAVARGEGRGRSVAAGRVIGSDAGFPGVVSERLLSPARCIARARSGEAGGVDWNLLAAVAREESRWDPGALSAVGARGLVQLMPATASARSRPVSARRTRPRRPLRSPHQSHPRWCRTRASGGGLWRPASPGGGRIQRRRGAGETVVGSVRPGLHRSAVRGQYFFFFDAQLYGGGVGGGECLRGAVWQR